MEERRVVVTGIGVVTSLGENTGKTWDGIINSKTGIRKITRFPVDELPESISKVAGEVRFGEENGFNPDLFIEKKDQKKMGKFIWCALGAAEEALTDAGWKPEDEENRGRTGVAIGSGIGGLDTIESTADTLFNRGITKISPFFIPASLINLASGNVSIKYGFTGPNHATVTACASGAHAIGDAAEMIKRGVADVMVAGGAEAAVCQLGIGGFSAMHALSTAYNNDPEHASRPWDKGHDGFVMGEGAGILVLEEYEHAKKRGAKIYGEVIGYGMSGDAYHLTSPESEAKGQRKAVVEAMKMAGLGYDQVDYINAHGTSTPTGDPIEFNGIKKLFEGNLGKIHMSSTKGAIGHLLGAAGAVEAAFCLLAIRDSILPPTLNLVDVDDQCHGIDLVPLKAKKKEVNVALSNSFGFGGTNACLVFRKI